MASGGIKLAPLLTELKVDIKNFKSDMQKAASVGASEADRISKELEHVSTAGEKMSKVGDYLTIGVTTPLLAAGTAVGKFAIDAENSMAMLQGQLGLTAEETERLQEVAQGVYENGYGDSIESCVSDLALLRQNVRESKEWTDEMTQSTLEQIETITALFDTNADKVTRTVQVMKSSGLIENVSEGLDIITYGFQNGANYSGEMLDTLREYSPQFVKLGLDADSAMQLMIQGAENGAFNLDKVGDALKELSIRVVDGSDTTVQGFEAAGLSADEMAQKFATGGETAKAAFQETLEGLASIEDPVERNIAGVNLFGTMWEDLGETVILSLADVEGGLEGVEGATERAGEGLNNTFSARVTSLAREFKDSLLPLGEALLDIGEEILPDVKDGIEDFADMMEDMDSETAKNVITFGALAAAAGPVIKTISGGISVYTKLSSVMGGAKKAADTLSTSQSALTGKMTSLLGTCGPLAGGFALGATAAIGLGKAIEKARKDAEKADLEEHFGDIVLSAEEVEDIAERLTTNDWTMRVDAVIDAKEKLEELETTIQESIETINKTEWKVGIGLELTDSEKEEYQQSVTDYISGVQDYINQQRYTASLAVDAVFEPGSDINTQYQQSLDRFYNELSGEFTSLGEELAELSNQAWEDNFLSEDELNAISDKRAEIQKKLDEIAQAEYDLELDSIKADATKDGLSADSFQDLQESLSEKLDEREAELEDTKRELLLPYQVQYNNGEISLEEFDAKKKEVDQYCQQQFGDIVLDVVNIEAGEIRNAYADEVNTALGGFYDELQAGIEEAGNGAVASWDEMTVNFAYELQQTGGVLKGAAKQNVTDMLKNMEPEKTRLEKIAQSYRDAGEMIPESVSQGLMDIYQLEAVTGHTEHIYELMAMQIATSPEYQQAIANAAESGLGIPEELAAALESNYGLTYNATTGMFEQIAQGAADSSGEVQSAMAGVVDDAGAAANNQIDVISPAFKAALEAMGLEGISGMEGVVKLSTLSAPGMKTPDWTSEARIGRNNMQGVLDNNPLSITIKAISSGLDAAISAINSARSYNYNGIDNVPYDGYQAVLHKGERVLTAEENKAYSASAPDIDYTKMEQCMRSAVRELTLSIGHREFGRIIDNRLRERGLL